MPNKLRYKTLKLIPQTWELLVHNHSGPTALSRKGAGQAAFRVSTATAYRAMGRMRRIFLPSISPLWLRFAQIRNELSAQH